jgi:hypothetical protein
MPQYVSCKFPNSRRAYSYVNEGEPLAIDDQVEVPTRSGATVVVTVESILDEAPPFELVPIIRKVESDHESQGED